MSFSNLTVVIPAFNEEEGIAPTIGELKEALTDAHMIVIDGESEDRTFEIAKDFGVEVLIQNGTGKGSAISQGLVHLNGDIIYVAFIDADYTYPAIHLKEMIKLLDLNPKVGMVLGNRFNRIYELESVKNQFYIGNRILAYIQSIMNGVKLNDPLTGLRVIRYELLNGWKPKSMGFDIEVELNCRIKRSVYDIFEMPIKYR
ncbi:glycosyltransferase family 2 protein [Candidatus Bathyarchaeota archaeon]|nr:glycosyltransferase family 2 protein [Candidatus Bathyarchaeota archaeon]